jgi:hypothetical protein
MLVWMKKLPMELSYGSIKIMQVDIHKCITWPKKLKKGYKHGMIQTCINSNFMP